VLSRDELVALYRKRARRYDLTANLYYLIGFREWAYRKKAVAALRLKRGDVVVEIGCGTGLNFGLLEDAVGPGGKVIGVDMNDAMLARAQKRVVANGLSNVSLVRSDAADYPFPEKVDGILSTFALTLVPEYDEVIRRGAGALPAGGRWVVADLKLPESRLSRIAPILLPLVRPFGVTLDISHRHPWESLRKHMGNAVMEEVYFGFAYIACGTA
jgi:demethylmenaquinone methyltransferase/2-methoxy-6-polyprenyl-1,4-benzoquinol methylase